MAAWFTIFCRRPVADLSAERVLTGIREADLYTLAEGFGIDDEDAVDQAARSLRIEPVPPPGTVRFRLRYGPPDARPILVHVWAEPEDIADETRDHSAGLDRIAGVGADRIRARLAAVAEVVALELGWGQTEDMGSVFASLVAEMIAAAGDGVVRDHLDQWWGLEGRVLVRLDGPPG